MNDIRNYPFEGARVSFQECLVCGGVVAVLRDPEASDAVDPAARFGAARYMRRDGTPFTTGSLLQCEDCHDWWHAASALVPEQRRWGVALPPKPGEEDGGGDGG